MQALAMKGKVYLMGAGPADTDLLTVKAVRVLRAAEVVLHDDLVSPQILELVPASAQVRNVRKLGMQAGGLQERSHSLPFSAKKFRCLLRSFLHQITHLRMRGFEVGSDSPPPQFFRCSWPDGSHYRAIQTIPH